MSVSCNGCGAITLLPEDCLPLTNFTDLNEAFKRHNVKHIKFSLVELAKRRKWKEMDKTSSIMFEELKRIMEKLGVPQTHLEMKSVSKKDENMNDKKITLRECVMIYSKISEADVSDTWSLYDLFCNVECIDVTEEGIPNAVNFFEAKIAAQSSDFARRQADMKREKEERERQEAEKAARKNDFNSKMAMFNNK